MNNTIQHILFIVLMSMMIGQRVKAGSTTDGEGLSAPLMMFDHQKGKEEQKKESPIRDQRDEQQLMRERLIPRGDFTGQGMKESAPEKITGTFSAQYVTTDPMISSINSRPSIPLEAIKEVISRSPDAQRLVPGNDQKSLVVPNTWYGTIVRAVFGDDRQLAANQQARAILRASVSQKYSPEIADRVCPPIYDREALSASQANRIVKMVPVIHEKQNEYPLSDIRDETMSLLTYARDTALAAQPAVTKLLAVRETLLNELKQRVRNDLRNRAALKNHPDFIAAREDAIQATLHASEAAEAAVAALQKVTTEDSSFGAHSALAAAQFHATIVNLAKVKTGEEKYLDYKVAETLWSATDAHDAYEAYRNAPSKATSSSLGTTIIETRKQRLQQALSDLEATIKYATEIINITCGLSGAMAPSCPFEMLLIQRSYTRVKLIISGAAMKAQQIRDQLVHEKSLSSEETNVAPRSEDEFCRDAATQRILAGAQRIVATLEDAIETTLQVAETEARYFFTPALKEDYLTEIKTARQTYEAQRGIADLDEIER